MTEIKFGDEAVEIAAEAGFSAEYRWRPESWNVLSEPDKDSYRSVARAVLEALVASGWRREALTCQENAEPTRLGIFTDTHLHECAREQGHRSAVHRCACNTEWWEARQYVSAGTREQEDQERDEENEHPSWCSHWWPHPGHECSVAHRVNCDCKESRGA